MTSLPCDMFSFLSSFLKFACYVCDASAFFVDQVPAFVELLPIAVLSLFEVQLFIVPFKAVSFPLQRICYARLRLLCFFVPISRLSCNLQYLVVESQQNSTKHMPDKGDYMAYQFSQSKIRLQFVLG